MAPQPMHRKRASSLKVLTIANHFSARRRFAGWDYGLVCDRVPRPGDSLGRRPRSGFAQPVWLDLRHLGFTRHLLGGYRGGMVILLAWWIPELTCLASTCG